MTTSGMNRSTGLPLGGLGHLQQSVDDILTTPIGSRVMRPDYGSTLINLLDKPAGEATRLEAAHATAEALSKWEPRISVIRTDIAFESGKEASLMIVFVRAFLKETKEPITLRSEIV